MQDNFQKRGLVILFYLAIVVFSYYLAYLLRFDFDLAEAQAHFLSKESFLVILIIHFLVNYKEKLDRSVWAKVSVDEAVRIVVANMISMLIVLVFRLMNVLNGLPLSVIIIMMFINILGQFSYRFLYRYYRIFALKNRRKDNHEERVLIYGAGSAGQMLAAEILEINPTIITLLDLWTMRRS